MKLLTCREHGGTFKVATGRGRPPTKCGGKYEACSNSDATPVNSTTRKAQAERAADAQEQHERDEEASRQARPKASNPSVELAMQAKAQLEAQGWLCKGRGHKDEEGRVGAELMATRGEELLVMHWLAGQCVNQEYLLWSDKPSANNKPASNLGFDPDECTDRELIRTLAGSKVTWWNKLGQFEQSAIVDASKIQIEHLYNNVGDETPSDRIVKFIDKANGGFKAFRLGALLKVG